MKSKNIIHLTPEVIKKMIDRYFQKAAAGEYGNIDPCITHFNRNDIKRNLYHEVVHGRGPYREYS